MACLVGKVWMTALTKNLNQKVRPCNKTGEQVDFWKSFYWEQVLTGFLKQMHCLNRCNLGSVSLVLPETKTEQDTFMAEVLFQMPIYYLPLQPSFCKHLFFPSFYSGYAVCVHNPVDLVSLCFVATTLIFSAKRKYVIIKPRLCDGQ